MTETRKEPRMDALDLGEVLEQEAIIIRYSGKAMANNDDGYQEHERLARARAAATRVLAALDAWEGRG